MVFHFFLVEVQNLKLKKGKPSLYPTVERLIEYDRTRDVLVLHKLCNQQLTRSRTRYFTAKNNLLLIFSTVLQVMYFHGDSGRIFFFNFAVWREKILEVQFYHKILVQTCSNFL